MSLCQILQSIDLLINILKLKVTCLIHFTMRLYIYDFSKDQPLSHLHRHLYIYF